MTLAEAIDIMQTHKVLLMHTNGKKSRKVEALELLIMNGITTAEKTEKKGKN